MSRGKGTAMREWVNAPPVRLDAALYDMESEGVAAGKAPVVVGGGNAFSGPAIVGWPGGNAFSGPAFGWPARSGLYVGRPFGWGVRPWGYRAFGPRVFF